jgi:hypothetical protein
MQKIVFMRVLHVLGRGRFLQRQLFNALIIERQNAIGRYVAPTRLRRVVIVERHFSLII